MSLMNLSPVGKALIQSFEQCRLEAYQDQKGVWTIGWGHTGPEVVEGSTCTPEQADAWFDSDILWVCHAVDRLVFPAPNQFQFDALVSLIFNIGSGNFASSTLRTLWSAGDVAGAADQFLVWDQVSDLWNAGLRRRREAERALFLRPVTQN